MKIKKIIGGIVLLVLCFIGVRSVFAAGPAAIDLGSAGNFIILSKTAISTTGVTAITGDIGVSPAAATYVTGFSQTMNSSNKYSTSTYVTGKIYASDYAVPTPSYTSIAVTAMEAAYVDGMGRTSPTATELGGGNIGGMTITPGLYKWTTGVTIPTDVTLSGGASDVWIFQIDGNLDISSAKSVLLTAGVSPANIFWVVAGTTTLNTTSTFEGTILAGPGTSTISMKSGAVLHGRALGQKDITLIANTVNGVAGAANANLTVTKVVINDNGKTNVVSDFPLFVGATSVISGVSNVFTSGDYVVSEGINSAYTQSFSGDCDSSGKITLYGGVSMSCIITNNDIAEVGHSSGGGGVVYGCKDPTATNYNYFSSSKPSLCVYKSTSVVSNPTTTTTVTSIVIPKLPKTGFPPQEKWYESFLNSILNLFR